ncbi:MAG TPA: O-methyltransferase [Acidimicrobiales bacterium]
MSFIVGDEIEAYAAAHTTPEEPWMAALADDTRASMAAARMMTGHLEGRFLEMLVFALQPQLVLEIGTFTGYGALSLASALPPGGRVVTCDVDEAAVAVARRHAAASPYGDRIEFRLGPALDTIATIDGPFDLVFIDADKPSYPRYFEAVLPKLSDRGVVAIDNVLWSGRVAQPPSDDDDESTSTLRGFNHALANDARVVCVMTTVRDGVTLVRRRT